MELIQLSRSVLFKLFEYKIYSPEVAAFHESSARIKIASAPARTSKSYAAAKELAYHFFPTFERDPDTGKMWPYVEDPSNPSEIDRLLWVVGVDYNTIKEWDYLVKDLHERRGRYGLKYTVEKFQNNPSQGHMKLVVNWGTTRPTDEHPHGEAVRTILEGKSATNEKTLQGEEVYACCLSESAEHDARIWQRYLSTRCKYSIWPTTPKLKALWIKNEIDGAELNPGMTSVEHWTFKPDANPMYDWRRFWDEHKKAESRVTGSITTEPVLLHHAHFKKVPKNQKRAKWTFPEGHDCFTDHGNCAARKDKWFAEQFLGVWTLEAGRVLPFRWDESETVYSHVIHRLPTWFPSADKYVSVDYGYDDACVALWWAVGPDDTKIIYREIYDRRIVPNEFVKDIHERSMHGGHLTPYGEHIRYHAGDPKRPEVNRLMRQLGLKVWDKDKKAQTDRAAGHLRLVNELSDDPRTGRPMLFVASKKCGEGYGAPKTIIEWRNLRYKDKVQDEFASGAIVGDDHAFDTAKYFLQTRPKGRTHTQIAQEAIDGRIIESRKRADQYRDEVDNRRLVGVGA